MTRFVTCLNSRGVVRVGGIDSLSFLQSLVTADIHSICAPQRSSTATGFLDRRGRLLFGALIHSYFPNEYLIDIASNRVSALLKHLRSFRLRSAVDIDNVSADFRIWQFVGLSSEELPDGVHPDPRLPALGSRTVLSRQFSPPNKLEITDESDYERLRILKGIPDGRDFESGGLPLQLALHLIDGVSFKKGCYLGQELTARSHFTGILRKRLTTVMVMDRLSENSGKGSHIINEQTAARYFSATSSHLLKAEDPIFIEGRENPVGKVSSAIDNLGVAVLRLADAFEEATTFQLEDGRQVLRVQQQW